MKFKARLFKEMVNEMFEFDEGSSIDNNDLHDMIAACWEYHNAGDKPDVSEEEEKEMIKDFILFDSLFLNEDEHWMWLKPKYKKLARETY